MRIRHNYIGLALTLAFVVTACATFRHNATVASGTVYNALAAMQDTGVTLHNGGALTDTQYKAFSAKMVTALQDGRAFNSAVAAWPHGKPVPPTVKETADQVFKSASAAVAELPLSDAKNALVTKVLAVAQAVVDTLLAH